MNIKEMEKHKNFLLNYAITNGIVFRVSRRGITIEQISKKVEKSI